jgi:hypothetical protein
MDRRLIVIVLAALVLVIFALERRHGPGMCRWSTHPNADTVISECGLFHPSNYYIIERGSEHWELDDREGAHLQTTCQTRTGDVVLTPLLDPPEVLSYGWILKKGSAPIQLSDASTSTTMNCVVMTELVRAAEGR